MQPEDGERAVITKAGREVAPVSADAASVIEAKSTTDAEKNKLQASSRNGMASV